MVLKNFSACDNSHHGPWGSRCLFVKNAKEKCQELGASLDDFRLHLDYTKMEELDSGEVIDSRRHVRNTTSESNHRPGSYTKHGAN